MYIYHLYIYIYVNLSGCFKYTVRRSVCMSNMVVSENKNKLSFLCIPLYFFPNLPSPPPPFPPSKKRSVAFLYLGLCKFYERDLSEAEALYERGREIFDRIQDIQVSMYAGMDG